MFVAQAFEQLPKPLGHLMPGGPVKAVCANRSAFGRQRLIFRERTTLPTAWLQDDRHKLHFPLLRTLQGALHLDALDIA